MKGQFDFDDLFDLEPVDDQVVSDGVSACQEVRLQKLELIRVAREQNLKRIFPETLEDSTSYHFISTGDIDALSYLSVLIERFGRFSRFYGSTWTLSRPDCEMIDSYLSQDSLAEINFCTGEYFAKRETSVYASLLQVVARHNGRLKMFKNHCKLLVLADPERDLWLVCEGSANFTTNPRAEQTVITRSKKLFDFYADWFDEIFAPSRN